jgi:hypothetical protein
MSHGSNQSPSRDSLPKSIQTRCSDPASLAACQGHTCCHNRWLGQGMRLAQYRTSISGHTPCTRIVNYCQEGKSRNSLVHGSQRRTRLSYGTRPRVVFIPHYTHIQSRSPHLQSPPKQSRYAQSINCPSPSLPRSSRPSPLPMLDHPPCRKHPREDHRPRLPKWP